MSVRINLEIGHEASIRTKRTPEGFTHDWEVFVRGCDDAEIHYYIEKVVFYLHETFQKPTRVVKWPPYSVKESGYAGFQMLIDIYLRNRDEPKMISFTYDLDLPNSGPRIVKTQKEKYVFTNPNEEFMFKLLKGGGTLVNSSGGQDNSNSRSAGNDEKPAQMTSKPKLSGGDVLKKYKTKIEEPRISDSFQELFGTPITKTSKISPDPQKMAKEAKKDIQQKSDKSSEKEKSKSKHSPYKEKDKDKSKDKESDKKKEEKKKERNKEREKSSRHEKSPTPRNSSPKPKRASSPKRPPSPPVKHKEKEERKDGGREKEKHAAKKDKRDKEHKENRHKEKDSQKSNEKKDVKASRTEASPAPPRLDKKEKQKDKEIATEPEKIKTDKSEEKKHKHRKKDKDKKEKKADKERVKNSDKKLEKSSPIVQNKEPEMENSKSLFESPKSEPVIEEKTKEKLKQILPEDSSNSPISSRELSPLPPPPPPKIETKKETTPESKKNKTDSEKIKTKKEKKEKKNKDKKSEKEEKKRKRKSDTVLPEEPPEKQIKDDSNSDVEQNQNIVVAKGVNKENQENPEDYMQILRELQRKIMTLQDNTELQKVVQLIAETGRFEVSARTFDFDLCLLDRSTVRQLQEFFSGTSS